MEIYTSSTFNRCTHKPLRKLKITLVEIKLKPIYDTRLIKKASIVPLLLRAETKRQLDEDVKMGIINKCPENQHPEINNRMHVVPKGNGKVRRTIDMRFLNLQCTRELNYTTPPFQKVQDVPQNTWKSVLDAWNG